MKCVHRPHSFAAQATALGLIFATPAFAETTLVCDMESSQAAQDTPTILMLNEAESTVSGKFGASHITLPGAAGRTPEEGFSPVRAVFTDQEIVLQNPRGLPGLPDSTFHLNRLSGALLHINPNGDVVGDQRRCRVATKQF